jgi:hypothetical protein
MKNAIRILKEVKENAEACFIENSITVHQSSGGLPVPDTQGHLETIIELNQAISVLEKSKLLPTVEEAGIKARNLLETGEHKLEPYGDSNFIGGFIECIRWMARRNVL